MEQRLSYFDKMQQWIKNSVFIRLFTIGILILFLLIPVNMVEDLIRERKHRKRDAINNTLWSFK
ncbi:MAG: hypothetical protein GY828_02855 [Candidatus Gracilibacteria bacterium]|nr:hypothetical protein [Candidatus Gracilibacteria bacterium]